MPTLKGGKKYKKGSGVFFSTGDMVVGSSSVGCCRNPGFGVAGKRLPTPYVSTAAFGHTGINQKSSRRAVGLLCRMNIMPTLKGGNGTAGRASSAAVAPARGGTNCLSIGVTLALQAPHAPAQSICYGIRGIILSG